MRHHTGGGFTTGRWVTTVNCSKVSSKNQNETKVKMTLKCHPSMAVQLNDYCYGS